MSDTNPSHTNRATLKLTVALAATWLVLAGPASVVGGIAAVEGLTYAALLCLVPHLMCLAFVFVFQPQWHPLADLVLTMAIRLVVVLAGIVVICWHRPDLRNVVFIVCLAACYFVALAVETRLQMTKAGGSRLESINGHSISGTTIGG